MTSADTVAPGGGTSGAGRRRWPGVLLGVALLVAGAGAWLLGQPAAKAAARVLGANQPVNATARERRDLSANNSPALAANPTNPTNLVVANRIDLPAYSCGLHVTLNGGTTWDDTPIPFPAGEEEPARCYAPDVAYTTDGLLHVSFVTLKGTGNVPNAVWTVSSGDGGRTLTVPVQAAGPLAFQVQLTADPEPGSGGRLYLTWLQAEGTGNLLFPTTNNPIVTSASTDGGATWTRPVQVSPANRARVVAPAPAVGPQGELDVAYLDLGDDRLDYDGAHQGNGGDPYDGTWTLILARSTNHGATWDETVIDGAIVPTQRFIVFLPPTPTLAIDQHTGRIYTAFTNGRLGDADINLWTSTDNGKTFRAPVRVNDTPLHDRTAQYLPKVAVAPDGRLDVAYYDRRADQTNIHNEVSLQSSFDQGRTFTPRVRVTDRPFDSRIGQGSERNLADLGSSLGLLSTTHRALTIWPDTRGGNQLSSKQDLASAVITIPNRTSPTHRPLRVTGAGVAALGLAALVLTATLTRRSTVVTRGPERDPTLLRPQ